MTTADDIRFAAAIMDKATDGFVLATYAVEGLEALIAAGWTIQRPIVPLTSSSEIEL